MSALDRMAEERIARAVAAGELSGLPGEGRPLQMDDDAMVPLEQRAAMRVLKNAGYVPEEVRQLKALRQLEKELESLAPGEAEAAELAQRLLALRLRLEAAGLRAASRVDWARYAPQLQQALSRR